MGCSLNDSSCNWSAEDSAYFQRIYIILFAIGICVLVLLVWACCICPYICQRNKTTIELDLTDDKVIEGPRGEPTMTPTIQGEKVVQIVGNDEEMINSDASDTSSSNDDSFADGQDGSRNIEEGSFEDTDKEQSFVIEIV